MSIKEKLSLSLNLLEDVLQNIISSRFNTIPKELPNLTLSLANIKAKFENLMTDRNLSSINPTSTSTYITALNHYLQILSQETKLWKGNLEESQEEDLLIILSKLETLAEFLEIAPYVPLDDLFSINRSDERWKKLNQITEVFHADKAETVKRNYFKFMSRVASSQAFVSKAFEEEKGIKRTFMLGLGSMYYTVFKSKALRRTQLFYARPRLDAAVHVWNLLETKMLRNLMSLVIKSIKFNQVIHVPRIAAHVLENYSIVNPNDSYSLVPAADWVMLRILNTRKLPGFSKKPEKSCNKLIFHIHGGGFVSMSSASHQAYTRIWSRDVGVPVVSVDYRLAPKHPYPEALDDVWQVWNWFQNYAASKIGLEVDQYVIVGDSGGANLGLALAYKIIKSGLKPPAGLVLAYPALNIDKNQYSPSLLLSLEDLLVPHSFLKLCLEAYLQGNENVKDPTISPVFIEDQILQRFPPVRMIVGTEDPLHDECFRFAEKLLESGNDVKLALFSGAFHGGLNYCFKGGVKETKDMVNKASVWMKEFLEIS